MEYIPGYDEWKTTPPDEPDVVYCANCGKEIYISDSVNTADGYLCEDCIGLEGE